MKAVILAAGRGERLVNGMAYPKPLKRVAGVPLIVRILRNLERAGVRARRTGERRAAQRQRGPRTTPGREEDQVPLVPGVADGGRHRHCEAHGVLRV